LDNSIFDCWVENVYYLKGSKNINLKKMNSYSVGLVDEKWA
jgi:hypothetical protein